MPRPTESGVHPLLLRAAFSGPPAWRRCSHTGAGGARWHQAGLSYAFPCRSRKTPQGAGLPQGVQLGSVVNVPPPQPRLPPWPERELFASPAGARVAGASPERPARRRTSPAQPGAARGAVAVRRWPERRRGRRDSAGPRLPGVRRRAGRVAKWLFQIRGPACAVDTVISFNEKF